MLPRILQNVETMLRKRNVPSKLEPLECKGGNAYRTSEMIVYVLLEKMKIDAVRETIFLLEKENVQHLICIVLEITPGSAEHYDKNTYHRIELFYAKFMLFDPTENVLVPPHRRLSPEEVQRDLPGISMEDLPSISIRDRIVRYYGWPLDSIIRIDRKDSTYFRRVVRAEEGSKASKVEKSSKTGSKKSKDVN